MYLTYLGKYLYVWWLVDKWHYTYDLKHPHCPLCARTKGVRLARFKARGWVHHTCRASDLISTSLYRCLNKRIIMLPFKFPFFLIKKTLKTTHPSYDLVWISLLRMQLLMAMVFDIKLGRGWTLGADACVPCRGWAGSAVGSRVSSSGRKQVWSNKFHMQGRGGAAQWAVKVKEKVYGLGLCQGEFSLTPLGCLGLGFFCIL